jgi:hypothetical protein
MAPTPTGCGAIAAPRRAFLLTGPARLALFAILVGGWLAVAAVASAQGLAGLRRVSLAVDLQYPIDTLSVEDLLARLEEGLRQSEPPVTVNESATDRLRLTIGVRPMSATTLRGYWLPFSGTYGIGPVILELERMVVAPGGAAPFPAIVWQAERTAAGPWRTTPAEVVRLLDDLIGQWQGARRQAR